MFDSIRNIMDEEVDSYRDRIFSPLIPLSAFLSQVLKYQINPAKMRKRW